MTRVRFALALLTAVIAAAPASEAQQRPEDVVSWTARAEGGTRGTDARLVFTAALAPGWKMYALDSAVGRPLTVAVDALPRGVAPGTPRQRGAVRGHDPAFGAEASTFAGTARVEQPLRVDRRAARGRHAVTGVVRYAVCDAQICLPPAAASFRVTLRVR
ncbi:MAG TPA: protein-disulfide reductase DsbD domain-containing protein [Rubricoccaceae bacterium]|jgi:thiol:disulfide interchange protein DsbD